MAGASESLVYFVEGDHRPAPFIGMGFAGTRRPGTGAALTYAVETFEGTGQCDERYSGVITIFTRTNTLRGLLTGTESDCVRLQISITGTKN